MKEKALLLTEKDRRLLMSINKSLEDIRKGKVKEFLSDKVKPEYIRNLKRINKGKHTKAISIKDFRKEYGISKT